MAVTRGRARRAEGGVQAKPPARRIWDGGGGGPKYRGRPRFDLPERTGSVCEMDYTVCRTRSNF
jgi:hypothetical protein